MNDSPVDCQSRGRPSAQFARESERRKKVEQMEHQAQEQFRKQQLELLEKSLEEQEIQNKKISKQNEELLKLEREKAEDIRRMRLLRDEEYYKT